MFTLMTATPETTLSSPKILHRKSVGAEKSRSEGAAEGIRAHQSRRSIISGEFAMVRARLILNPRLCRRTHLFAVRINVSVSQYCRRFAK